VQLDIGIFTFKAVKACSA